MGKRGRSSKMASSIPEKKKNKTYGKFFGKRKFKLSNSSLLFP